MKLRHLIFFLFIFTISCAKKPTPWQVHCKFTDKKADAELFSIFKTSSEDDYLFSHHCRRLYKYGRPEREEFFLKKIIDSKKKLPLYQYSVRNKLGDQIIFLRALFNGKLLYRNKINLQTLFARAVFLDLGSAILFDQGAPTVREIFEDKLLKNRLSRIIASDINDYRLVNTQFVNIYRKTKNNLPFPVVEIDSSITDPSQFLKPLSKYLIIEDTPLILRTVDTGIDYFYGEQQLRQHFLAMIKAFENRNVLYLFNKFMLFKPQAGKKIEMIGEIDESIFAHEYGRKWTRIDWAKRNLADGFSPEPSYLTIKN